ncbi:MAG: YihY family inner membrane protein [Alcanivoracaceae bacterium]|jgi:membrane protein|nr:YihY family inner membrane protein [Alcanivoracaceae bacterium]
MNQPASNWHDRLLTALAMVRDFFQLLASSYRNDGCRESAAALTYTTLFAIVPIMTVAFAILTAIPALQERSGEIQAWAFANFAPGAGEKVLEYVNEFSRQAGNLTAIGVVFLVVTSVLMLSTIEKNMNRIWRVTTPRSGLTSLIMYWAVLTLGPLSLGAALGISSYLTSMALVADTVEMLGGMRLWLALLPLLFMTMALTLLYVVVPNCYVPIRQGLIGGFVAAVLFELAKGGFTLFIKLSPSYQVVYGAFAAVPIFLLWIFISWNIVLGGAELVRVMVVFGEYRSELPKLQSLLRLLEILWRRQQQGRVLRVQEVRRVLKLAGASHWEEFRNLLMDLRLMRRTENGEFVLSRDLGNLTLIQLLDMLPWNLQEALRVSDQHGRPWEPLLAARCQQAREGLESSLDLTIQQLFRGDEQTDQVEQADERNQAG